MIAPRDRAQQGGALAPIVTSNATITCIHGGQVLLVPTQEQVTIQGGPVMCEPDLVGALVVGCAQPPTPSTVPCTAVISTLPGSSNPMVLVGGRPVYIATLSGITNGVPPGAIMCVNPGQTVVV
jgi:hypothetical protein